MNNLFLYVDNHYIAAAIRDDNDVMKPVLPKTEDEFYSLFFGSSEILCDDLIVG